MKQAFQEEQDFDTLDLNAIHGSHTHDRVSLAQFFCCRSLDQEHYSRLDMFEAAPDYTIEHWNHLIVI